MLLSMVLITAMPVTTMAQEEVQEEKDSKEEAPRRKKAAPQLLINGTNQSATFTIDASELPNGLPIQLTAPNGFTVTPATIPATAKKTTVKVTLNSTKSYTEGILIMRSGDIRKYVKIGGYGTALPAKDISKSPIYKGTDNKFEKTAGNGFAPTAKGYTVEFRTKANDMEKEFNAYFVDGLGNGLKANINSGEGQYDTGIALYCGSGKKGISNPFTSSEGGRKKFYNTDGLAHTYRFAVTPDQRMFIYRDGLPIDTVRLADYGTQPDFAVKNGEAVENLLRNPGFEGDFDTNKGSTDGFLTAIEGWNIAISDRYCSEQYLVKQELDNTTDFNNHILKLRPYKWSKSWGDPQIIQIVDVAPNETYTLSALARGGIKKKEGKLTGKIVISEMQDREKKAEAVISSNTFETYSLDYTTSANCKQLRIVLHTGGGGWGEDISPLEIDNVKLTGVSRKYAPKIGFENLSSDLEYFTYDLSGAYAPVQPQLDIVFK